MQLTVNSKVKDLTKIPGAVELIEQATGKKVSPSLLKIGRNMSLQVAGAQMGWSGDQIAAMVEQANRLLNPGSEDKEETAKEESGSRVAIITGGTGGIGSAIAKDLAEKGFRLALVDIDKEKGSTLLEELGKKTEVDIFTCDVSSLTAIEDMFAAVLERFGQADVVVNTAGIPVRECIDEIDAEVWERFVNTNIRSVFFLSKLLAEHVSERGSGYGRIINISSIRSDCFDSNHTGYSLSKAALDTLTKCFAVSYGASGITANSIAPGFVHTGMTDHYMEDERAKQVIAVLSPLGRMVKPEEIGAVAGFLCTDGAAAVNGQIIKVNGGGTSQVGLYH